MNKMLSIILVLAVCGCVGLSNIFPTGAKTNVKEQPQDVIVVQNLNTLPKPPINAGDQFSISYEVSNLEENRYVGYVGYTLLDPGLCVLVSGGKTVDFTTPGNPFAPKQTEFVEWVFDSPRTDELVHINSKCPVRFKVTYTFDAISEIEVDVISDVKYEQMKQTGEFQTFTPTLTLGRGPLKIYMEFGSSLPVKTETVLPVYLTVEDKGTGLYSQIPTGALKLTVPSDFSYIECGDRFNCLGNVCTNTGDPIIMIDRKSPKFRCSFTTPSDTSIIEKLYNIEASLSYTYDVINQVDVDIKIPGT
jgi:hypothetical protein